MFDYDDLIGHPYVAGRRDCFSLIRDYYWRWGVEIPNIARPKRFWEDPNLNLYATYEEFGFQPVFDEHPRIGDTFLMPLLTPFPTHAAVLVSEGEILHHAPNRLSCVEPFRPRWSNRVLVHLRHPKVTAALKTQKAGTAAHFHEVVDAQLFRDPEFQEAAHKALATRD